MVLPFVVALPIVFYWVMAKYSTTMATVGVLGLVRPTVFRVRNWWQERGRAPNERTLAKFWQSDGDAASCPACQRDFSYFTGPFRHHCRKCGYIFCEKELDELVGGLRYSCKDLLACEARKKHALDEDEPPRRVSWWKCWQW